MKTFLKYIFILPFLYIMACEEKLELKDPTQISEEDALQDGGIEGVAITMYNSLQGVGYYGARFVVIGDVLADNAKATLASNRYSQEYDVTATSSIGTWATMYNVIQSANTLLKYVDVSDVTEARKNQLKGEAYFIRALAYHDLIKTYAYDPGVILNNFNSGVILRTEAIGGAADADFKARATVDDVYAQIISDLTAAIGLLDNDGVNYRATKGAAQGLLARVYLFQKNYTGAITAATDALSSGVAELVEEDNYVDAWHGQFHPEALFELRYNPALENPGPNESLVSITTPLFWGDLAATQDLIDLFEPEDVRNDLFFEADISTGTYTYQSKWTGSAGTTSFDEDGAPIVGSNSTYADNVPIIRYSEILLIRAEAYAENDQDALALADLNALRAERGVADLSSTGTTLIEDILDERRRELMFEGHRWFTLKRKGMDIPKPEGNVPTIQYVNFKILSPLPQSEVDLNPLLIQNPGY